MPNYSAPPSATFAALSDATRCAIVDRLCRGPATVSELAEPFSISLPTLLQHLRLLEASGLVSSSKSGRVRTCQLESAALGEAEDWIRRRRSAWVKSLSRLERFLDEQPDDSKDQP